MVNNISNSKEKEMKAKVQQEKEMDYNDQPASDVYAKAESKDPETGVERPTEASVEEAKAWVDQENRR